MSDHKHGSMSTDTQEATFNGFISWSAKVSIISICLLVFIALVNG